MQLSIVVAVAENGVIGRDGQLPWHLSADLRRFKRLTMDHAILMGRRTWESIGRALPGRTLVVISRQTDYQPGHEGVFVVANLDEALSQARKFASNSDEAFIIGGARIYEMSLPRADRLFVTRIHAHVEGDAHFPKVDWSQWRLASEERHEADDNNDYAHTFQTWLRQ